MAADRSPVPPPTAASPSGTAAPGLPALVAAVREDAAQREKVDPARVVVRFAQAVTWPDGSLGCPQPGRLYTQALVGGYRVRLDVDGRAFDYHANAQGRWFLCPPEQARDPIPDGGKT